MSFYSLFKKKQNRLLSKAWRATLDSREYEKIKFQETGNIRQARELKTAYKLHYYGEPTVIYSAG